MQSFLLRRSQPRIAITLAAILALIMGVIVAVNAPKAHAADVQPAVSNLVITDSDDNPVTEVKNSGTYKLKFDFQIASATPGDTFRVTLPEGFRGVGGDVALGEIATATRQDDSTILVTFTDAAADLENLEGGFSYLVKYYAKLEDGAAVSREATIGNEAVYIPEIRYGAAPGLNPMTINKWSGNSTDSVNTFDRVRLSGKYSYAEVSPAEGQTFAKWFIELNNWNTGNPDDAVELGDNIVVTDTLQSLGDFTPQLVQAPREGVSRVLTEDELDGLLDGPYVKNRQDGPGGNSTVEVSVRGTNGKVVTLHADVDDDAQFLTITENADGTTSMVLLLSEFLAAQYPNLNAENKAVLDDPRAQYSLAYIAVMPAKDGRVENTASFTSTENPEGVTDEGYFQFVDVEGWGDGEFKEQPSTNVIVEKKWEGLAEGEATPEVTFSLLANGKAAIDLDQNPVEPITLAAGTTTGEWMNLPTQLNKGEAITYTVKEESVEGFKVTYGAPYVVDLNAVNPGRIVVTNTKNPAPSEPPATETTVESVPVTTTVVEPVETTVTETVTTTATQPSTVTETASTTETITATETETIVESVPVTTTVVEPVETTITETASTTETITATETETTVESVPVTTTVVEPVETTITETASTTETITATETETIVESVPVTTTVVEPVETTVTETVTTTVTPSTVTGTETNTVSSGSSENATLNRCVSNALASPLLWLIPVGLLGVEAGKAAQPYAGQLQRNFNELTSRLGMGGRYDKALEQLSRDIMGKFGNGANNDPFREQRREAQRFVSELNQSSSDLTAGIQPPRVELEEAARVAGPLAAIVFAGAAVSYWCTTPEGETFGAQLSS